MAERYLRSRNALYNSYVNYNNDDYNNINIMLQMSFQIANDCSSLGVPENDKISRLS